MGAPIRIALIGLGWVAEEVWLPMLLDDSGFEVTTLVDVDPAALARAGGRVPSATTATSPDEIRPEEVDLAVVAVPNHLHTTIAAPLLRRGVAVFIEKPVCLTSGEAAELIEAERAGGSRVLAGSAAWHRADVKALRAVLDRVGPLRTVELSWVRGKGIPASGDWFTRRAAAGGGALFDLGWHLVNIGMRMQGWPAVTEVIGSVSGDFLARPGFGAGWRSADGNGGPSDVEDTAHGCLRTDNGVLMSVTAAWASHNDVDRTTIVIDGAQGRAELSCTFGFSPLRVPRSELWLWQDGTREPVAVPEEPVGAEYRRQLGLLPTLLADPGQPGAATAEVAGTVAIIERIYASARVAVPARR